MKVKKLYNLIKESLAEVLKEQDVIDAPVSDFLGVNPDSSNFSTNPMDVQYCDNDGVTLVQDYGSIYLYTNNCDWPGQKIDARFICCSTENPVSNDTPNSDLYGDINEGFGIGYNTWSDSAGLGTPFTVTGAQGTCYTPPEGASSFTFQEFKDWVTTWGGWSFLPGVFEMIGLTDAEGSGCGGCAHPLSSTFPLDGNTPSGCENTFGELDPLDLSCCSFAGCGASGTVPPASNLTTIPETINNNGVTFPAIVGNEQNDWWNDSGCYWNPGCTLGSVTISVFDNNTQTSSDQDFITTQAAEGELLSNVVTSTYGSIYDGTPINDDGSCQIAVCTNENIQTPIDGAGQTLYSNFIIAAGTYTGYEVIANDDDCYVTGCGEEFANDGTPHINYITTETFGGTYTVNHDINTCVQEEQTILGCTDIEANNYNDLANEDDGSCTYDIEGCMIEGADNYNSDADVQNTTTCIFTYCTDNTTFPESTNYVCLVNPQLCLNAAGDGECTLSDYTCQPNTTLGTWANTGCTYPIVGCMDDGGFLFTSGIEGYEDGQASNYNPNATLACDGENSTISSLLCQSPYGEEDVQDISSNPNGCCCTYLPGCTDPNAFNYDPNAYHDDGSCIAAVYGCTYPGFNGDGVNANTKYSSDHNINQVSATDTSNPCVYSGCIDDGANYAFGDLSPSSWSNYICVNNPDITIEGINPADPEGSMIISLTEGEWLCQCGNYPDAVNECTGDSQFNTSLGTFNDPNLLEGQAYSLDPLVQGSCTGGGGDGCSNNGINSYIQNPDGNTPTEAFLNDFNNWSPLFDDNGSCVFFGCDDPNALNYFCNDNPDVCLSDLSGIDPIIGTINSSDDDGPLCVYPEKWQCSPDDKGCIQNFVGIGEYDSQEECEEICRICSNVEAVQCGTMQQITHTFNCLEIDGNSGDATGADPTKYTIGDYFIDKISIGTTNTGVTSQGNFISYDRPKEKFKDRVMIVKNITNSLTLEPTIDAPSGECADPNPVVPGERPRPFEEDWICGNQFFDMDGNPINNDDDFVPSQVDITCCNELGYPITHSILTSIFQSEICGQGTTMIDYDNLEDYCQENYNQTAPPCDYAVVDKQQRIQEVEKSKKLRESLKSQLFSDKEKLKNIIRNIIRKK